MHAALLRGGTHHDVPGRTLEEVLGAVAAMPEIPEGIDRRLLRDLMVAREGLASTGVGRGVAIPHARDPVTVHVDKPVVLLCFLREPVDFRSIDGIPVTTLFALLSPGVRPHLRLLARLAWLLHDEPLNRLLAERSAETAILDRVLALEERIGGPGAPPPPGG
jgi:PTS system nitrogen regulatory IIA component